MEPCKLVQTIGSYHSVFLALPLDEPATRAFDKLSAAVQKLRPPMTFQKTDTVHLTLRFFDRVNTEALQRYIGWFEQEVKKQKPFRVRVDGFGYFGRQKERNVLWLKVYESPGLIRLAEWCQNRWPERRPFVPHITLGRVKNPGQFSRYEQRIAHVLANAQFTSRIDRFRLYGEKEGRQQVPLCDWTF